MNLVRKEEYFENSIENIMPENKNLRHQFADTMNMVGGIDQDLVVVVGDISHGILSDFRNNFPERYFNIGICEPGTVNVCAGLSKLGFSPVIHTIAPFLIERSYEQIKLDFGYQNLGVNLISVGGAFDYSKLGCSHHCYTDISLISHLPSSNIFTPGSCVEFDRLFRNSYKNGKINYFRLTEYSHGITFPPDTDFTKGQIVKSGKDITIATYGAQLKNAIIAEKSLAKQGISCEVLYFATIKPFDDIAFQNSVLKTKNWISIEEHSEHDGLFNLCMKATYGMENVKSKQLAISGFVKCYGTYEQLCKETGLNAESLEKEIKNLLSRG